MHNKCPVFQEDINVNGLRFKSLNQMERTIYFLLHFLNLQMFLIFELSNTDEFLLATCYLYINIFSISIIKDLTENQE